MFHSLTLAMATKGATHPTTEAVHVLPFSTKTQESGEECTAGSHLWTCRQCEPGATHLDHDTSDDSNGAYCVMPRAHI